jgi:hypothetical protein
MGRYSRYQKPQEEKRESVHPIWRGIGCLMIFLILVMSFAGASVFLEANQRNGWIFVPDELLGSVPLVPIQYANLIVALFFALIGFGIFVIIYSLIFRVGTSQDQQPY